jgi:predicted transcriptional regulator
METKRLIFNYIDIHGKCSLLDILEGTNVPYAWLKVYLKELVASKVIKKTTCLDCYQDIYWTP